MNQKLKFSLSVLVNQVDSEVNYSVTDGGRSWSDGNLIWHEWEYDPTKILIVSVTLTKLSDTQSHIIISNLAVNGVAIDQFDQTGTYIRFDTGEKVKNAYGYMSWSGVYSFKIRYSPKIHNYITYLAKLAQ